MHWLLLHPPPQFSLCSFPQKQEIKKKSHKKWLIIYLCSISTKINHTEPNPDGDLLTWPDGDFVTWHLSSMFHRFICKTIQTHTTVRVCRSFSSPQQWLEGCRASGGWVSRKDYIIRFSKPPLSKLWLANLCGNRNIIFFYYPHKYICLKRKKVLRFFPSTDINMILLLYLGKNMTRVQGSFSTTKHFVLYIFQHACRGCLKN